MATTRTFRLDQLVFLGAVCLIFGYLLGFLTARMIQGPASLPSENLAGPAPAVAPPSSALGSYSAEIRELENIVQKDAKNREAWVRLGNLYFDTDQYTKSIDAYTKALELQPNDPDVITDRGIMYRKIGEFEKAAAEFRRAAEIDPTHLNSVLNLGVVLQYDLNDSAGAAQAWRMYLDRNPPPEMAEKIRREIDALQSQAK
jgi:cytochrome c-type biogenesis protein CcmH/NrfG